MAYIPQFIPTNTQALQGTLDQYQKASDTQTALQHQANDIYSAIPTTRMYDTGKKNEVMGTFSKTLDELDKKYNYDRSNTQYANELASKITQLRSNPLWAHIQQKDELDKVRTNLIANRGADYIENFNPNDVTLDNAKQLQSWKPMDIKDVKMNAAMKAKEFSTAWMGRKHDRTSVPGTIQYIDQWGAKNEHEAETYLKNHPEELEASIPEGFDKNDPRVRQAAANAWISNAVGETKPSDSPDNAYLMDERNSNKTIKPLPQPIQVSTGQTPKGTAVPYATTSLRKISSLDKDIANIKTSLNDPNVANDPNKVAGLTDQLQEAEKRKGDVLNVKTSIENIPDNKKIIDTAHQAINDELNKYKSFITGDKSQDIYDIIHNGFINKENKTQIALKVTSELQKYTDPSRKISANTINSIARDVVSNMDSWYNSKHNYVNNGYRPIKQQIEKELSTGYQPLYNKYALPSEMQKGTEKGEILKMTAENTQALSHVDNTQLTKDEADNFSQAFDNANTQFNWLTDNQGGVLIELNYPGDGNKQKAVTGTFKVNPETASFDLLSNLAKRTGDPNLMSQVYSNFNLTPNREYSINNKDGYLASRLGRLFPTADGKIDTRAFKDFTIEYIEDPVTRNTWYNVTDPEGKVHNIPNKVILLQELANYKRQSDTYYQSK